MKKERVRSKHGFKGLGKFFLGWFVGFVSTILLLVGLGYWAYTSINLRKIEKWTKNDITDNEGLEKLTLKKAVAIMQGLASTDSDAYTLAKLEEDFDIELPDTLGDTGITLDIIKNSSFKNFEQAIEDTIDTITFNNILKFLGTDESADLGVIDTILETETTYYISNGKLYTNAEHTIEVDFDYNISGSIVKLNTGVQNTIASSKVKFSLSDLPLNSALTSMTSATKKLKVYELLDYYYDSVTDKYYQNYANEVYSNPVSGVMDAIAGYTIDDLADQDKINNLKIHEVMGYYYNEADKSYYTSDTFSESSKVAGVMNTLAGQTIGDLSKEETFNNLYIYEVMGYYEKNDNGTKSYYLDYNSKTGVYSNPVTGIMATIAGKTIDELDDDGAFNDILVADALGYTVVGDKVYDGTTEVTGVVKQLVLKNSTISSIANDVKTLNIGQILDIKENDPNNSTIINALYTSTIETLNEDIKDLKLGEILDVEEGASTNSPVVNALWGKTIEELNGAINDLTLGTALGKTYEESTGVIRTFYNTKISELAGQIEDIQIWQAMGYTQLGNEIDGYTYKDANENPVTGIMATLASKTVSDLSNSTTFNDLYVYEIMGYTQYGNATDGYTYKNGDSDVTGVMLLMADAKMSEIPTKVNTIINDTTLGVLFDKGVIDASGLSADTKAFLSGYKIPALMQFINDNIDILQALAIPKG